MIFLKMHALNNNFQLTAALDSCVIKKEETTYFMSPMCFSIRHVMADLQGLFLRSFVRNLDTDYALLIEMFTESEIMIDKLQMFWLFCLKMGMEIFCSWRLIVQVKNTISCGRFHLAQTRQIRATFRGL